MFVHDGVAERPFKALWRNHEGDNMCIPLMKKSPLHRTVVLLKELVETDAEVLLQEKSYTQDRQGKSLPTPALSNELISQ